jgi:predicted  nucleic acid-binding Zn-ribbon protein
MEKAIEKQQETNKRLDESVEIKRKTVHLVQDAPKNIVKLQEEINNFDEKMKNVEAQWLKHKQPLEDEKETLRIRAIEKKREMQKKMDEIGVLKDELKKLNSEFSLKDDEVKDLTKDYENLPKDNSSTNRQFYTKRILEIVSNIEKQKKEIDKVRLRIF